jgi:y4mF family transcriptional regulator
MIALKYTLSGIGYRMNVDFIPVRVYYYAMENIGMFVRRKRKEAGLTQEDFAVRSGLGLRFVRELEEGKTTVRLDKVNQALAFFGCEAGPVPQDQMK